jgi:Fe2+ or Zn2+ uptake regulation protein
MQSITLLRRNSRSRFPVRFALITNQQRLSIDCRVARVLAVKSPTELTELFRARGLKVTPQRQAIFGVLHGETTHPTAESVYEAVRVAMPTMSLRTVYQTLNDLAAMGEVLALDLGTGSARFDPNVDEHHHLVCDDCGRVVDVYPDATAVRIPVPERRGFVISTTEVVFRGVCPQCQTHSKQRKEGNG